MTRGPVSYTIPIKRVLLLSADVKMHKKGKIMGGITGKITENKYGKRKKLFYFVLMALCAATALKILLVGYDIDEQYAVSMSYRLLKGDRLLADLWEPHQTSGWLCMLLMAPYVAVTGTASGIILYLRFCGLLLHGAVGLFLYRTLKGYLDGEQAFLVCGIYFFSLPKIMFLPEFSNIQMWCLMAAALCLLRYYSPHGRDGACGPARHLLRYLVLAGFLLALEVLSYPSTILAFAACIAFMVYYRRATPNPLFRELACLAGPCVLGAAAFAALLLSYIPLGEMGGLISMVAGDGSHAVPWGERLWGHGRSLLQIVAFFLIYAAAAFLLQWIYRKKTRKHASFFLWCRLLLACTLAGQVCIWLFGNQYPNYPMAEYFFLPVLLLCAALRRKAACTPMVAFLVLVPLWAFAGVLLFSNHPLLVSVPFLAPCVVGILALPRSGGETNGARGFGRLRITQRTLLVLWLCVLLFGRCFMLRTTGGRHETIFDEISLMRRGPAMGLIADTPEVVRYRDSYELVAAALPEGARVFYMGRHMDLYLMKDLQYAIPSTTCTPTFDDKIYTWFERHPEKGPDYVVCDTGLLHTDIWVIYYVKKNCLDEPVAVNDYLAVYQMKEESRLGRRLETDAGTCAILLSK